MSIHLGRRWFGAPALLPLLLLLAGCAPTSRPSVPGAAVPVTQAVYPGAEWARIEAPESVGWAAADLEALRQRLRETSTTGFVAIVGGRILMDYGDLQAVSFLASVRKSVLAMLFGRYVEDGTVRLDKTLAEIGIDDIGGLTAEEKQATIRDLMTTRSGIYHPAANAGDDHASAPPRGSQRPGAYFLYNNWDFNALGTIFEKETGRDIYEALETDLARPLGMQDFRRTLQLRGGDPRRSMHLAYHMFLSTRDLARVGYLMLRHGEWSGRQVVPRRWVEEITRPFTPVSELNPGWRRQRQFGYSYGWWVWDGPAARGPYRGAYAGIGAVGQHLTVIPVLDLVVAHKTAPGQGRAVSHTEYLMLLDELVSAACARKTCEQRS